MMRKTLEITLGGCPGALGKLASKGMFRTLFGPAVCGEGGIHRTGAPPLEQSTFYGMKLDPGSKPSW